MFVQNVCGVYNRAYLWLGYLHQSSEIYTGLCHYIFEIEYMRGRKSQTRKLQYTMSKIKAFKKLPRSKVNSPLMIKFTGKNWNAAINFFSCHSVFRPNSTTPPFFSYILVFLYYSNHAGKKWMHHVTNMDGSRAKKKFLSRDSSSSTSKK